MWILRYERYVDIVKYNEWHPKEYKDKGMLSIDHMGPTSMEHHFFTKKNALDFFYQKAHSMPTYMSFHNAVVFEHKPLLDGCSQNPQQEEPTSYSYRRIS